MCKPVLWLMPALTIFISIAMLEVQTFGSSMPITNLAAMQTENTQASPPSSAVLNRGITAAPKDKSEEHFQLARESFLKKNTHAAAIEILEGAAFLKREAGHATGEGREALQASVRELEGLAQGVEQSTVTSVQDLRRAFAHADRALAEAHFQSAIESWSKKEAKETGRELQSAANDVELSWSWAGQKLNAAESATVKDARNVATRLSEGAGWTKGEVGQGLDKMSREIGKLGQQV